MLRLPDFGKQFIVSRSKFTLETDASENAVGAVLSQEYDGKLHPVAYFS